MSEVIMSKVKSQRYVVFDLSEMNVNEQFRSPRKDTDRYAN